MKLYIKQIISLNILISLYGIDTVLSDSNEKLQSQWEMRTGCLQFSEIWETAEPIGNFNSHAYFPINATVK